MMDLYLMLMVGQSVEYRLWVALGGRLYYQFQARIPRFVPEPERCIQCGICSFNCPIGIDVRLHAWLGEYVEDSYCLTCGECVERCPRGVLHFEKTDLFMEGKE